MRSTDPLRVSGVARVDRRTKDLVQRIQPGEIAVIDHLDLDRVAAEALVLAQVGAVVNAAPSISGRYPNMGPLLVAAAGIPLLDDVGHQVMDQVRDGARVTLAGDELLVEAKAVAHGRRQTIGTLEYSLEQSRQSMGAELSRFAENTLQFLKQEGHLLLDDPHVPEVPVVCKGRHVLIVVRGVDYREDLALLRNSGYLQEFRPILVGVDGGADALVEVGYKPDIIIGDFDSVSEKALRSGAALVVHGYADGRAPGARRLDALGLEYQVFASVGTSEDIAMLLAYEGGADLIVAVGTHSSMADFLDKGRGGMSSTFLVRMKVGPRLVDAKGVSRLYGGRVRRRDLMVMVVAALVTLAVVVLISEPIRLWIRATWLALT